MVASDETVDIAEVEVLKDAGGSERLMTRLHRGMWCWYNCNDNDSWNTYERDWWQDFIEVIFYFKNIDNTYYHSININDINCNDDSDSSVDSSDNSWNNVLKILLT